MSFKQKTLGSSQTKSLISLRLIFLLEINRRFKATKIFFNFSLMETDCTKSQGKNFEDNVCEV